jgi:predicted MFS family arabinose efflux permease
MEKPEKTSDTILFKAWAVRVISATVCRVVLNTARRFPYTFAPVLSRGLGVPLTAVTSMIAVNQATGILGIFYGPLLDRFGYRNMMTVGISVMTGSFFFAWMYPSYGSVFAAIAIAGLGKNLFDPAIQAYVGANIPLEKRGRFVGMLEFSWAGSTLIGIPVSGLLMEKMDWKAPLLFLASTGLAGFFALRISMPPESSSREASGTASFSWYRSWKTLIHRRPAVGVIGLVFLISGANDQLFVVYGAWLERCFNLSALQLGFGTGVIGCAELLGEAFTVAFADRIGLRRSILLGGVLSTLSFVVLPFSDGSVPMALAGLFFVFVTFEFTIVALLSLTTEIVPGARGTMIAAFLAAAGAGRVLGALSGGALWLYGGISAVVGISAAANALGLVLMIRGLYGSQFR